MEEHLTTRQVADALQVSESTVKRWCDSGTIPTIRTQGGHRRIPLDGLVHFLESSNRRIFDPKAIGLTSKRVSKPEATQEGSDEAAGEDSIDEHRIRFRESLLSGDELGARRALVKWYTRRPSIAGLADELVAKTFHHIGELWACEKIDVYQERRGCEICLKLIHELRRLIPEVSGDAPVAIGGAPSQDHYSIPSQLIELVLKEGGWRASNLGCNLPLASLLAAAKAHHPKLVWLSVSHIENLPDFLKEFRTFSSNLPSGTSLVVGGRALNDSVRPLLQFTAHCDNLQQMANLAVNLRGVRSSLQASDN